jgi:poly(A) polymerase
MEPNIINRDQHPVSRTQMSQEVLKVLYRLHGTGHLAYLCGGGVRDLLLGREIGDYDVATDAEPKRLKEVFGNCRLVGRRFRIAHILFRGGKIIEVSTFRKQGEEDNAEEDDSNSLLIKRDNTFGSPADDAFRRDFTINALYYNVADFSIIDYVGGRADLQARVIRSIGDPDIRFQEDPIRILRGIRLAATLGFEVAESTWEGMKRQRHHILDCSVSRIREEIMKILRRQASRDGFHLLVRAGILEVLFPKLEEFRLAHIENKTIAEDPILEHLGVLEDLRKGTELSDSVLLATLTAAPVKELLVTLPPDHDVGKSLHEYLEANFKPLAFPRIVRSKVHLLHLALRHMLAEQRKKRRRSLRRSPIFADALKFLEIHCLATNRYWSVLRRWQIPPNQRQKRRTKTRVPRSKRIP